MKREYTFALNDKNEIHYVGRTEFTTISGISIATIICDNDDAIMIQHAMQLAINAKIESDKTKSNPPGRYSVIKN